MVLAKIVPGAWRNGLIMEACGEEERFGLVTGSFTECWRPWTSCKASGLGEYAGDRVFVTPLVKNSDRGDYRNCVLWFLT